MFHSLATNLNVEPKGMFTSKFLSQSLNNANPVCTFQSTTLEAPTFSAVSG
ncbi:MAG: hypothetical protein LBC61_00280 [Candidatus Peribacteria bacterium]|nr:hypothetical protein [Candidatus Peribacteria bacterium]